MEEDERERGEKDAVDEVDGEKNEKLEKSLFVKDPENLGIELSGKGTV